ncbi:MAG: hypothetical protein U9P11_09180 [Pseudomonadota bacterium]|nr:hypothetical protein [Pseudomonadota bacterium]
MQHHLREEALECRQVITVLVIRERQGYREREHGPLGACPGIAIVARARLIESDFSII